MRVSIEKLVVAADDQKALYSDTRKWQYDQSVSVPALPSSPLFFEATKRCKESVFDF